MRIIYTHDIFSRQSAGGISRYFCELIRGIASRAEVSVLAGWHCNRHLSVLDQVGIVGRHLASSSGAVASVRRVINRCWQETALPARHDDVIHQTYYSFLPPRRTGRAVLTICDMIPERYGKGPKARAVSLAKQLGCRRAARILAISHHTRDQLCDLLRINPDRVDVVPLGVSAEAIAALGDGPPLRREPYLLQVGSRRGYKNWSGLMTAFASSRALRDEFKFVCFGGGTFSSTEWELLHRLGIEKQVLQSGGDDAALAREYRHATGFVYPSLDEGFGLPPLEAMAAGCPVACAHRGAIPEVVGDAGLYFDPADNDDVTAALERLVFDSAVRESLQPKMARRVIQFTWQQTVEGTLETYRRAA